MTTVLICDHHRLFAEAFASALRAVGADVRVAADPAEALAAQAAEPADRVLMSVRFPGEAGRAAIREIQLTWPQTHVACLGADDPAAEEAVVLSKKRPLTELVDAVLRGTGAPETPAAPAVPRAPLRTARVDGQTLAARFLTDRERDVLRLLVGAQPTGQIADELGISITTTRGYVQSILSKLGVHSRVQAVSYAVRHSVVS
ncbi:helix-turn-helix transcriptional regulator [Spirilliplanes yamanashiensis]|uniref:DNA-binding response regulator n=1 Tax=Spirilliplanes yamanashiensis TaxID=42233 RepID=A0A8J4DL63_9ACTN|nr:response regulator transcription factor [Spirilliplanes yamanashiensis]MDP9818108.1 two-component system nitrate/nitrite response regulator NarL [Spirilliplanes yamanashiensis]GIJ04919.1 DNA-binding response regulator [Spirilliplanes yamanashiensis]